MNAGEIRVWRVRLDEVRPEWLPEPAAEEAACAARLRSAPMRQRYLRAHGALRAILRTQAGAAPELAIAEKGKPYLANVPRLNFNLSHSHGLALVAVALEVEVGVDVERLRPLPLRECQAIAERFFPPSESAALEQTPAAGRERDFFRRWTRIEAALKARGVGLYGAGAELGSDWTLREIEAGEGFAAAVAAPRAGMTVTVHDFEQ